MNKYITLFGSLVLFLVFVVTFKTTLSFPTDTNILISIAIFSLTALGFYKFLKPGKTNKKSKEEFTPVLD